jgi:hypothetical protein
LGGTTCQVVAVFYRFGGGIGARLRDGFDLARGRVGVLDLRVECFGLKRRPDQCFGAALGDAGMRTR